MQWEQGQVQRVLGDLSSEGQSCCLLLLFLGDSSSSAFLGLAWYGQLSHAG